MALAGPSLAHDHADEDEAVMLPSPEPSEASSSQRASQQQDDSQPPAAQQKKDKRKSMLNWFSRLSFVKRDESPLSVSGPEHPTEDVVGMEPPASHNKAGKRRSVANMLSVTRSSPKAPAHPSTPNCHVQFTDLVSPKRFSKRQSVTDLLFFRSHPSDKGSNANSYNNDNDNGEGPSCHSIGFPYSQQTRNNILDEEGKLPEPELGPRNFRLDIRSSMLAMAEAHRNDPAESRVTRNVALALSRAATIRQAGMAARGNGQQPKRYTNHLDNVKRHYLARESSRPELPPSGSAGRDVTATGGRELRRVRLNSGRLVWLPNVQPDQMGGLGMPTDHVENVVDEARELERADALRNLLLAKMERDRRYGESM